MPSTFQKISSTLIVTLLVLSGCSAAPTSPNSSSPTAKPETSATAQAKENSPSKTEAENTAVPAGEKLKITALKGPTAMGMAPMIKESAVNKVASPYDFSIVASPDEIIPALAQGKTDFAALPANLAAILYRKTDKNIKVLAINTLGVLYLVENGDTIHNIQDLKGKTICLAGKGATPEYALLHVLKNAGLEVGQDITLEYKSEHAECVSLLSQNKHAIALLPQPFVAAAMAKNPKIHMAIDLNKIWAEEAAKNGDKSALVMGVLIARKDILEKSPEAVAAFLKDYQNSITLVNSDVDKAAEIIGDLGIVPSPVAKKALPHCNITYLDKEAMQQQLSGYLKILFDQNPKAVGGQLPDEDFYYLP